MTPFDGKTLSFRGRLGQWRASELQIRLRNLLPGKPSGDASDSSSRELAAPFEHLFLVNLIQKLFGALLDKPPLEAYVHVLPLFCIYIYIYRRTYIYIYILYALTFSFKCSTFPLTFQNMGIDLYGIHL